MTWLKVKPDVLQRCPIKNRGVFLDWASDTGEKGVRKETYAHIAAGRPAPATAITKVFAFLLDDTFPRNDEAKVFRACLRDLNIPESEWTASHLLRRLTEAADPQDPFPDGLDSIINLSRFLVSPLRHVRPCHDEHEVREVTRWLFVHGGRRAAGSKVRLSDDDAIPYGERFVKTSVRDYADRLIRWWRECPWTVAVGGDADDMPRAMSVAAPVSAGRYASLRVGEADMFHLDLEQGLHASPYLFMETLAIGPANPRVKFVNAPQIHVFRTTLVQQAVLSDVTRARHDQPLRILSLGCFDEFTRMLRYFGYKPTGTCTPHAGLPLWERRIWGNNHPLRDSAVLGVWEAIQHKFRANRNGAA